jgi:predicted nuclease with RNAse H fold
VPKLKAEVIIGIDLAGKLKNPTGWATWKNKKVETSLIHTNKEILEGITHSDPTIMAIDAPFSLPKKGILRIADREMIRRGYRVFPPCLPAMKTLTLRAIELNKLMAKKGYETIEVHPTSTRKALNMPLKDWRKIQTILETIGLDGDLKLRGLKSHEIDAVTAALTAYLYMKNQAEAIGDGEEGYIIVPKKQDWRTLQI